MGHPRLLMMEINVLMEMIAKIKEIFPDPVVVGHANAVHDDFGNSYEHAVSVTKCIRATYSRFTEEQEKLLHDWHFFWMNH